MFGKRSRRSSWKSLYNKFAPSPYRLRVEELEPREMPAGGLTASIVPGVDPHVHISPALDIRGNSGPDQVALNAFFSAADGSAAPESFNGSFTADGHSVSGALTLTELSSGVSLTVANGQVVLGRTPVVELTGASGSFTITNSGIAGEMTAQSQSSGSGLSIIGLPGLTLDTTVAGMAYQLNTTGAAQSLTQPASLGGGSYTLQPATDQLNGAGDFSVAGPSGKAIEASGNFTITDVPSGAISVAATDVIFEVWAGSVAAVGVHSDTAAFTLDTDATTGKPTFELVPGSFAVDGIALVPPSNDLISSIVLETADGSQFDVPTIKAGPFTLAKATLDSPTLEISGDELSVGVTLEAATASLNFEKGAAGSTSTEYTAEADGISGTFALTGHISQASGEIDSFGNPGAFSLSATSLNLNVPNLLTATAGSVSIGYDPAATGTQTLLTADSLDVSVPLLKLDGSFTPSTANPGLTITTDGFTFGMGRVTVGEIAISDVLEIDNAYVELDDLSFSTSAGLSLGGFQIGADSATVTAPGGKFSLAGTGIAATVALNSDDSGIASVTLAADTLTGTIGSYLTLSASGVALTPLATGSDPILSVGGASASFSAGPLQLAGSTSGFTIGADGTFNQVGTFEVDLTATDAIQSSIKFPAWLPLGTISADLTWTDLKDDPADFDLIINANVSTTVAGTLMLDGSIVNLDIRPALLASGDFPIVGLDEGELTASGTLFGAVVNGGFEIGFLKVDANGSLVDQPGLPFDHTVFFAALTGTVTLPGGDISLGISLGFSQDGPLAAYFSEKAPILLEPITELTLTGVHGGVSYDAIPLVTPGSPSDLLQPIYQPTTTLTAQQFLDQVHQQAINALGSSLLFYVTDGVSDIASSLDAGSVTPLASDFLNAGYALYDDDGTPPTVTPIAAGQSWVIANQGTQYLAELVTAGGVTKLNISALVTTLDESLTPDLGGSTVDTALVNAFAAQDIALAPASTIQSQGTGQWLITGPDGREFVVRDLDGASLAVIGRGGVLADLGQPDLAHQVRLELGGTISSNYAADELTGGVDVILQSDGKLILSGAITLGGTVSADLRAFVDLSLPLDPTTHSTSITALIDIQGIPGLPAKAQLGGKLSFALIDANGNEINPVYDDPSLIRGLQLTFIGQAQIGLSPGQTGLGNGLELDLGGNAGDTADNAEMQLTIKLDPATNLYSVKAAFSGSASITGTIDATDLVQAEGELDFQVLDGNFSVFGAAELTLSASSPGLKFLRDAGFEANATFTFGFNTGTSDQTVTLGLQGDPPDPVDVGPLEVFIEGEGTLTLEKDVVHIGGDVVFTGVFGAYLQYDPVLQGVDASIVLAAHADVVLQTPLANLSLFDFEATGLIVVDGIGLAAPQIAAILDMQGQAGNPYLVKIDSGDAKMVLNLTGADFTYTVPASLEADLADIEERRQELTHGAATFAPTSILDGDTITIPGAPPKFEASDPAPVDGPYFTIELGTPTLPDFTQTHADGSAPPAADASITFAASIAVTGAFRFTISTTGVQLLANGEVGFALPTFSDFISAAGEGVLQVTSSGLLGGFAVNAHIADIPDVGFNADFFLEINTTAQAQSLTLTATDGTTVTDTAAAHSAEFLIDGELDLGAFQLTGLFGTYATADVPGLTATLTLDIDAGLDFFSDELIDIDKSVQIDADFNFDFDASLNLNSNNLIPFSVGDIFTATADLEFEADTATDTFLINASNLHVELLSELDFTGSGTIRAYTETGTGDHYLDMQGSFSSDFFGVATLSASGDFDSRGYFDLNLHGSLTLGSSDYGISASANFYIDRSDTDPLSFGGDVHGSVVGFGHSFGGVDVGLSYDADSGDIKLSAELEIDGPFGISIDLGSVDFTIGTLKLSSVDDPNLGSVTGNQLVLNVGADAVNRNLDPTDTDETVSIESLGAGSITGEKLRVRALGGSEVFDNVTSISADFGDGNDSLTILPDVGTFAPISFDITDGNGNDQLANESAANGSFSVGSGSDTLIGGNGRDTLTAGSGTDYLIGGGHDMLIGGSGSDTFGWRVGDGNGLTIEPGTGPSTLQVDGTNAAEVYTVSANDGQITVAVTGDGPAAESITAAVTNLKIDAAGGADTILVNSLPATGNATFSLGSVVTGSSQSGTQVTGQTQDDNAADTVDLMGTSGSDDFTVGTSGGMVQVTRPGAATVFITDTTPALDTLNIAGGAGNDTYTVDGTDPSTGDSPSQYLKIALTGGSGNDLFQVAPGNVAIDGGGGNNTVDYRVGNADSTGLTLSATQFRGGVYTSTFTRVQNVGVDVENGGNLLVQSTPATATQVTMGAGGQLTVLGSNGPLNVALTGGSPSVVLQATGGPVAIAGGTGSDSVEVGTGLLSQIGGSVSVSGVNQLTYDDAMDGPSRTVALDGASLTGMPAGGPLTHSGISHISLFLGLGDDSAQIGLSQTAITVDGGSGTDSVSATLNGVPGALNLYDPNLDALQTANVESVQFANANNSAATSWVLNNGVLSSGSTALLDAGTANSLTASLGQGSGNTVNVYAVGQITNLTVPGSDNTVTVGGVLGTALDTLDNIADNLTLTATGPGNALIFDDSQSPTNNGNPRLRTFAAGTVSGPTQGGTISFTRSQYATVAVQLGAAVNRVTLADAAYTSITGGSNDDTFTASGSLGNLAVNGGAGNDTLILEPGSGTVSFSGGAGIDTVVSDNGATGLNLNASFTSNAATGSASVAVDGLPTVMLAAPGDVEAVTMLLGAGNDQVAIDDPALPVALTLDTGDGDDTVNVSAITGATGSAIIDGQGGQDTIRLIVPGAPTAGEFLPIAPTAEKLVIDNTANPAAVNWVSNGTLVSGNGVSVVDTSGADQVLIEGGTSAANTLQVTSTTTANSVSAAIAGDNVNIAEGSSVLSFDGAVGGPSASATVTGLTGAQAVATSPNGQFVYTGGTGSGILVAQLDGQNLDPVEIFTSSSLNNPAHMAFSSDGTKLFVEATDSSNNTVLVVLGVDATTGRLTQLQTLPLAGPLVALLVSPGTGSGGTENVIAVRAATGSNTAIANFASNSSNGLLQSTPQTIAGSTVTDASAATVVNGSLFVTTSSGTIVQFNFGVGNSGQLSLAATVADNASGTPIKSGNQVLAVPSQNLLLIYSQSDSTLRVYTTAPEFENAPVQLLQTIGNVGGTSTQGFDYDSGTGTLIVDTHTSFGEAEIAGYLFGSDRQFHLASTFGLGGYGGAQVSLATTPFSGGYRTIACIQTGHAYFTALRQDTSGNLTQLSQFNLGNGITPNFTGPVAFVTVPDLGLRAIAPYSGSQVAIIDPTDGSYTSPTNGYLLGTPASIQACPGSQLGIFWALEGNEIYSYNVNLVVGPLGVTPQLQLLDVYGLPVSSLSSSARLRFSADGLTAYVTDPGSSAGIIQLNLPNNSDGTYEGFSGITVRSATDAQLGLNAGDVSFTTITVDGITLNAVFVTDASSNQVKEFTAPPAGGTGGSPFTTANTYADGFNAFNLSGSPAIAGSYVYGTGTFLHAIGANGDLYTLEVGSGNLLVESTLAQGTNGVQGLGGATAAVEANGTLFVTSSSGTLARFGINSSTGIPSYQGIISDNAALNLADLKALAPTSGGVYVASAGENAVSYVPLSGNGFAVTVPTLKQGETFARSLQTLTAAATSSDGRYLYAVSAAQNEVTVTDRTAGTSGGFIDGFNGATGIDGVSSIAADPNSQFVAVGSATDNTITVFQQTTTGLALMAAYTGSGATGISTLTFGTDGSLYAGTSGGTLTRFAVAADGSLTPLAAQTLGAITGLYADAGGVYVLNATAGTVTQFDGALAGVQQALTGLGSVTAVASDSNDLFAVNSTGTLFAFSRTGSGGTLTLNQTVVDDVGGVTGMNGASAIALSSDGKYLFVAGETDNSIAVFGRPVGAGSLTYLQKVTDGRGGVSELNAPVGLFAAGGQLIAASQIGTGALPGGFSILDISTAAQAQPIQLITSYTGMASLGVQTYDGSDTIKVTAAPAVPTTISTGGGNDSVNLLATGSSLTVDLGSGTDRVDVDAADAGAALAINGGPGTDVVNIEGLGDGTTANVNVSGDSGVGDLVIVAGNNLAANSLVQVTGDIAATGTADVLAYEGTNSTLTGSGSTGSITESGQGQVNFTGLNIAAPNQQVFVHTAPRPVISLPASIAEGQSATFTVTDQAGVATGYAWDFGGSGAFADATGSSVTLTWAQLQALGIDTAGSYRIAVRATNTSDAIQFAGGSYSVSTDAAATLIVTHAAPTVTVTGLSAAVDLGASYGISFSASPELGTEHITQWVINWGDGTVEDYGSNVATASHTYTVPGNYAVTATASDEYGNYFSGETVQVSPGAGSITLGGPYSITEGQSVTLTATASGTPTEYLWNLTAGSSPIATTVPTLTVTWAQLNALGATGNSSFSNVTVTAVYTVGATNYSGTSAPTTIAIADVAPTGTVTANVPSIAEGSAAGALTVSVLGIADLSSADAAAGYTVQYDFNNDGTFDTGLLDPTAATAVPANLYSQTGMLTIRARLSDQSGYRDLFLTIPVTAVPPTLTILPNATTLNEGDTLSFTATPGGPAANSVTGWIVNFGDGTAADAAAGPASFAHQYLNPGSYTVTVTATSADGDTSSTLPILVNAVAPTVTLSSPTPSVPAGSIDMPYQLNVAIALPGQETVSGYTVNWGDGQIEQEVGSPAALTHQYAGAGNYTVQVTDIVDGSGSFADPSNTLTANVTSVAPTNAGLAVQVPTNANQGSPVQLLAEAYASQNGTELLSFAWTIQQPDGTTFTLGGPGTAGVPSLTAGADVTTAYQSLTGFTPLEAGTYTITLTVSDPSGDTLTKTLTLNVADLPPVAVSVSIPATGTAGQPVALSASFSDPGNDALTYTWTVTNTTTNAVATLTGASVSFLPAGGTYAVQLAVTDSNGAVTQASGTLDVAAVPPQIDLSSLTVPATANETDTVAFSVNALSSTGSTDGLTFTWQVEGPNGSVTVLTGSTVNFTFPTAGTYTATVIVSSADGESATASATTAVADLAPIIDSTTVPGTGFEGQPVTLTAAAHDPAGAAETVGYVWTITNPDGTTFTVGGPNASFTPPNQGTYSVQLTVDDGLGGTATSPAFSVVVANVAPTVGPIQLPATAPNQGDTVTLSAAGSDVPADTLTYTWTITAPNGTVSTLSGSSISFAVPQSGNYSVSLTVAASDGGTVTESTTLAVANLNPILQTVKVPSGGYVGSPVQLSASATDVPYDLPGLVYTWTVQRPDGSTFTLTGANAEFLPTIAGDYSATITVTDGAGGSTSATDSVDVSALGFAIGTFTVPATGAKGKPISLTVDSTNVEGLPLTFGWTIAEPNGQTIHLSGPQVTFSPSTSGNYTVTLTVGNGVQTTTKAATIDVANVPPTISQVTVPTQVKIGGQVALTAAATDAGDATAVLTYRWTITAPDGTTQTLTGSAPSFVAAAVGTYGVELAVTDGSGATSTVRKLLTSVGIDANLTVLTPKISGDTVQVFGSDGSLLYTLNPFAGFLGPISVAVGDVNGDGVDDIVIAAGAGGQPHIRVYDGTTGQPLAGPLGSFFAFDPGFVGGIDIALADVNGDGKDDIIVGAGPGAGPHVEVFDGATGSLLKSFYAFAPTYRGGVTVTAGDVNGDGIPDIVVSAGPGADSHISVFDGKTGEQIRSFDAFAPGFVGGVNVTTADLNGDGKAEIIVGAGPGAGPHVEVFDGATGAVLQSYYAFQAGFTGGVTVAVGNVGGTGFPEIIVGAGPGAGPNVAVFDSRTAAEQLSFYAFDPSFNGGVQVGASDATDSGTPAIVATALPAGVAGPKVNASAGAKPLANFGDSAGVGLFDAVFVGDIG